MNTNYIYSIYLARNYLRDDDIVYLHGDLVFEQNVLQDVLASDKSVMVTDSTLPLPEKDFKAVVIDGRIKSVSVDSFEDAVYAQPLYMLLQNDWNCWLDEICRFCEQEITGVYAENAFNEISEAINLFPLDVKGRKCFEVDTAEDLSFAQAAYKLMPDRLQTIYAGYDSVKNIPDVLQKVSSEKPLVVCGVSNEAALSLFGSNAVYFDGFAPNPDFNSIRDGISLYESENCDFIVSIGGGSAIDTAKCINVLENNDDVKLKDKPRSSHLSIPTTAGTGSESTSFAVFYKDGVKNSVEYKHIIPELVILDPYFLETLPLYHKKSSLLDALCQSIESLWAKKQTSASRAYAISAMNAIFENADGYMEGKPGYSARMLFAANLSGKAINISKTTAAHAMSYGLTYNFDIAHGHAVACCLPIVWRELMRHDKAPDILSNDRLYEFSSLLEKLEMPRVFNCTKEIEKELAKSVNVERMSNHPMIISDGDLIDMYQEILKR